MGSEIIKLTSTRENILDVLFGKLQRLKVPGFVVERNEPWPDELPDKGLVILRDGDPGEPEVFFSPLSYSYEHAAELEIFVQAGTSKARDSAFDHMLEQIAGVLADDRTLGGKCDWVEARAPEPSDLPIVGAEGIKAATVPVILHYTTSDPLA